MTKMLDPHGLAGQPGVPADVHRHLRRWRAEGLLAPDLAGRWPLDRVRALLEHDDLPAPVEPAPRRRDRRR
ncbi:hypothetical protein ACL02T_32210 [Pseudonocardia sp. RS010]|uniref:hypothetical protein n=1 Tax=Pseudonocardia sp. RS010 TaxID=3385979 RepID=UPI0039A003A5